MRHIHPDTVLRATEHAIVSDDGDTLLAALRRCAGDPNAAPDAVSKRMQELDWIGADGILTDLGQHVADSAREYFNWVGDGRTLPPCLAGIDFAGKRVLDTGCGFGRYLMTMVRLGAEATGVEPDEVFVHLSRVFARKEGVEPPPVMCASAESLPFPDGSFDAAFFIRSLEYTDFPAALAEVRRVITGGGRCYIMSCTLGHTFKRLRSSRRATIRRDLRILVNSLAYLTLRRRVIRQRGSTTGSPVRITVGYLTRCLREAGFDLEHHDPKDDFFVATRTA